MNEENRLLKLDNEWNESYPTRDISALDRIIAEDWVCIDGAGLVITKRQLLEYNPALPSLIRISLTKLSYACLRMRQS